LDLDLRIRRELSFAAVEEGDQRDTTAGCAHLIAGAKGHAIARGGERAAA
jgi:hypothetical protein